MKRSSDQMTMGIGFLLILAMGYTDFAMPAVREKSIFVRTMLRASAAKSELYKPQSESSASKLASITFPYPPLYARIFEALATQRASISLLIWQFISLIAYAFSVFLVGRAASKMDAAGAELADEGWFGFTYLPFILSIWNGSGMMVFGLLPLMIGYFSLIAKRYFLGGFVMAASFAEPCLLSPAIMVALATAVRGKPSGFVGLIFGLFTCLGINYFYAPDLMMEWLHSIIPQTTMLFDYSVPLRSIVANLPQAATMMIPLDKQVNLAQLVWLGASALFALMFWQISQLIHSTKENFNVAPLAFMCGLYLIPLAVPGVKYIDLSCLVMLGMIVFSLEWRQTTDWRLKSLVRVSAIAINGFGALAYFYPQIARPILLAIFLLILFRRLVEAIHIGAAEHGQMLKPPEPVEFID